MYHPWQRPFVDTNGLWVPCCMIANRKHTLKYHENSDIWKNIKFKNLENQF